MLTNGKVANFLFSLNLFWQLLRVDFCVFKQVLVDVTIDNIFWFLTTMIVYIYAYPQMGMGDQFAIFFGVGAVIVSPFWYCHTNAVKLLSDIKGNRVIDYFLMLPISNIILIIQKIISYVLRTLIPAITLFLLAKVLFWHKMSWANFSILKFSLVFVLASLFCGSFSFFIASCLKSLQNTRRIVLRFLFPMWFLGGINFSWEFLYGLNPVLARISLLNPLLYAFEGIHSAVEGPAGYLPFWLCVAMLALFTVFFTLVSYFKLKRRLDFL